MASIHKTENSPYYYCAFYLPNGRRSFRSTGTSSRRKAQGICLEYEKASRIAKEGRLTDSRARATISDIFHIANLEKLPSSTLEEYLASWLLKKSLEVADASYSEYEHVVNELKTFMGSKIKKPMDAVTPRDIDGFRAHVAARVSPVSVNKYLRILRGVWTMALREGIARENIFDRIEFVKADESKKRRAFRMDELKRILDACGDTEWRGIVLCGLYTGQRLGDCASIRWQDVDLTEQEIHIRTKKTGRPMSLPIALPLLKYFMSKAGDNPDAPVFPKAYASYEQSRSTVSRQFGELLARAGLAEKKDHHKPKQDGRDARRTTGNLSFHCLRHTATSLLKNAGVSDVVAREIIGHDSEAISRVYTHIEKPTLKKALNKMPDVTALAKVGKN